MPQARERRGKTKGRYSEVSSPAEQGTAVLERELSGHSRFGDIRRMGDELDAEACRRVESLTGDGIISADQGRALLGGKVRLDPVVRALLDDPSLAPSMLPLLFRDADAVPWTLMRELEARRNWGWRGRESGKSPASQSASRAAAGAGPRPVLDPGAGPLHDFVGQRFDAFARAELPGHPVALVAPDDVVRTWLNTCTSLVVDSLPVLGTQTLDSVRMIGVFDGASVLRSTQLVTVPGVVFLDASSLRDPAHGAELLLHEALHQKLDTLRRVAGVLPRPAAGVSRGRLVTAVWHRDDGTNMRRWGADRVLAAFHVYAHLVALAEGLSAVGGFAHSAAVLRSRSLFRARYLGSAFLRDELSAPGSAAAELVEWLMSLLPEGDFTAVERRLVDHGWWGDRRG